MANHPGTRSALLVVDVQCGVVAEAWDRDRIVGNVATAVDKARAAGVPVVWVQHGDDDLPQGSPAWQWAPELQPSADEPRIDKRFNSAFEDTDLSPLLDRLGVSRIVLAGASTPWCIRATAYGALDRGFDLVLLSDAHTTSDGEAPDGRVIEARSVVDDLNLAMRWSTYPRRTNAAVTVAEYDFSSLPQAA